MSQQDPTPLGADPTVCIRHKEVTNFGRNTTYEFLQINKKLIISEMKFFVQHDLQD